MGFEPTPSYEDQNAQIPSVKGSYLESGALDHSAILTWDNEEKIKVFVFTTNFDDHRIEQTILQIVLQLDEKNVIKISPNFFVCSMISFLAIIIINCLISQ